MCYIVNVPETELRDPNLSSDPDLGAWQVAFQSSKCIYSKYIKYLLFTCLSSSGTIYLFGDARERLQKPQTIHPVSGLNLSDYAASLMHRFRNPALDHRLAQIAMDGSQKLPQRWLETLAIRQQTEQQCPAILRAIAAWIGHIRGQNGLVEDPLAADLLAAATSAQPVLALFGKQGVLASSWKPSPSDIALIMSGLR